MSIALDPIETAIAEIAAGRPVVVIDNEDRENEGDLIFAAAHATPELVAFTVRHTSGYLCVAIDEQACARLELPPMHHTNEDRFATAYTVTVDAAVGTTTGISAADRARTMQVLADPAARPADLRRPGHVLPLRARPGGVLERIGHTEAAVDLARLAGLPAAGVLCEVISQADETQMARSPELREFANEHGLAMISIADLVRWREAHESSLTRAGEASLPTEHGTFRAVGYSGTDGEPDQVALVMGDPSADGGYDVLVRLHSECLTGEAFGSLRCDCGPQLQESMAQIAAAGRGVLVYLRGHEGRGIGIVNKLRAYHLQDSGADTVDANLQLGLPADARDYRVAGRILDDLGVRSVRLLTNNPEKVDGLLDSGITVTARQPIVVGTGAENLAYLRTKRDRMGHQLPDLEAPAPPAARSTSTVPESA
ncbi:bifunctional 3,4-dihydroxy-2-butanone-4-phosphate synthase/GTP cyclohydrolase II [Naumannella halotolerans]|uniref:bifunctional 3,4-dihydroxy-2-butanone-4-phosphate synthase/GTP cyclohydrolase II n=1 Tax=Naumannella halotolerans TaxID=993414 RepID=UPI00370D5965